MGFKWPETVIERPILTDINGSTVTFKDGSTEEYDVIIKCTGYLHDFPFMRIVSSFYMLLWSNILMSQMDHRKSQYSLWYSLYRYTLSCFDVSNSPKSQWNSLNALFWNRWFRWNRILYNLDKNFNQFGISLKTGNYGWDISLDYINGKFATNQDFKNSKLIYTFWQQNHPIVVTACFATKCLREISM